MTKPHIRYYLGLWRVVRAGQKESMNDAAWRWCRRMNNFAPYK